MANQEPEPIKLLLPRLAAVYEGNARYHYRAAPEFSYDTPTRQVSRWSQHAMLAVSSYTIAASHWSMIDPARAAADYWIAAMLYRSLNHNYWMPLALASGHPDGPAKVSSATDERTSAGSFGRQSDKMSPEGRTPTPMAIAFAMIGDAVGDASVRPRFDELRSHYGNVRIGRLGLPLDFYARCAMAMASHDRHRFAREAMLYLLRVSEILGSAAHDHFHWSRLHSSVLLAEPEAVAVGVAMSRVARERFDSFLQEIVPMEDPHASRIVTVSEDVYRAATSAEEGLLRELESAAQASQERDLDREREVARRVEQIVHLVNEELPFKIGDELRREFEIAPNDRERVAAKFRALASVLRHGLDDLPDIFVIFILEVHADPARIGWLVERVYAVDEFIARHAAWALRRAVHDLRGAEREAVIDRIRPVLKRLSPQVERILQAALREAEKSRGLT